MSNNYNLGLVIVNLLLSLKLTKAVDNSTSTHTHKAWPHNPNLVGFYLYPDSSNLTHYAEIKFGDTKSLNSSGYDPKKGLVLIIHGFHNHFKTKYSQGVKNAYLDYGFGRKANIVVMDWGKLATPDFMSIDSYITANHYYPYVVASLPIAGRRVADFLIFLMNSNMLADLNNTHLLGFSLGAHLSGIAGYHFKGNTTKSIGRITGLDPAGPLFDVPLPLQTRLKRTDAMFVDVIHTDSGQNGFNEAIGHIDFYPNGGRPVQPGCTKLNQLTSFFDIFFGSCSHNRAWEYYVKSMENDIRACQHTNYRSFKDYDKKTCPKEVIFGEGVSQTARGKYYLDIHP